jgi:hypothetical protein
MKYLFVVLMLAAGAANADQICFWTKISEIRGTGSHVVCQWKCGGFGAPQRIVTTTGYGFCPQPNGF